LHKSLYYIDAVILQNLDRVLEYVEDKVYYIRYIYIISIMSEIIYPQGCRSVTEDLGPDELIRRLKVLKNRL